MNSFGALIFMLVVANVCASNTTTPKPMERDYDAEWEAWKSFYSKKYKEQNEDNKRKAIWKVNLKKIEEYNNKSESNSTLEMNHLGDLSLDEYRHLLGTRYNSSDTRTLNASQTYIPPSYLALPRTVDWVNKGYVTGVKDQGQCGSCWAFSATGSLEGQNFKETGKLVSLSEQNLVDCSSNYGNQGCDVGRADIAFRYIIANDGIDTEASYPYTARDGKCNFKRANVGATCSDYRNIKSGSELHLQSATAFIGPISVAIDANHLSFQFPSAPVKNGGVYDEPACSSTKLDHAVLVVGYGTLNGDDYWLVKNSWGTSWGYHGYIRMSRNKNNQCGIATLASYPLVGSDALRQSPTNECHTNNTAGSVNAKRHGILYIVFIILSILVCQ